MKLKPLIILSGVLLGIPAHGLATPSSEHIDAVVMQEMAARNVVGGAVAVVRDGQIVHAKGYGHEDLLRTKRVTDQTIFRWASISKTLTAAATIKAMGKTGAFKLSDTVAQYVPGWPTDGDRDKVTIGHLLANRGGIIHYENTDNCDGNSKPQLKRPANEHTRKSSYSAAERVAPFKGQALCFKPGSNYKYSTFGFNLLGAAVEGATQMTMADVVNEEFVKPLGMTSLAVATDKRSGYDLGCGRLKPVEINNPSWKLEGGGWQSDIRDLAKFANGLMHDFDGFKGSSLWMGPMPTRPADAKAREKEWSYIKKELIGANKDQKKCATPYCGTYRLGINIKSAKGNRPKHAFHGGRHVTTRTELMIFPRGSDKKLGIVVMLNGGFSNANPQTIAKQIARLYLGKKSFGASTAARLGCGQDCPNGRFSAVWRSHKKRKEQQLIVRRGYARAPLLVESQFLRSAGYVPTDIEPRVSNGQVLWDAVFEKSTRLGSRIYLRESHEGLKKLWAKQRKKKQMLVDIETYRIGCTRYWAGIFAEGQGNAAFTRGRSTEAFGTKVKELAEKGYRLIDLEAYNADPKKKGAKCKDGQGQQLWAGVWVSGEKTILNREMSKKKFAQLLKKRRAKGYRLIDIEQYKRGKSKRYAAIWEEARQPELVSQSVKYCGPKNTLQGISRMHDHAHRDKFLLVDWELD